MKIFYVLLHYSFARRTTDWELEREIERERERSYISLSYLYSGIKKNKESLLETANQQQEKR